MKAWLLEQLNGLEGLRIADVPEPTAADGEVVLDIEYAALNPADRYLAKNEYPAKPPMPHVLGRDGVGVVSAVGGGVKFQVGQRLLVIRGDTGVNRWGTFAQRVAVSAESVAPAPAGWSVQESAGASLVYLTAYQALTQWGDLRPPGVVLVTGASGGVGVAATQLAKAFGLTVVALSRNQAKQKRLLEIGADHALDPADPNWPAKLKEKLAPARVDLAIDNIGGALFNQVIETMGPGGRVSVVGRLAGPVPQFNTASLFFRRLKVGGVAVGTYAAAEARAAWESLLTLLARRGARPLVDRVFGFDQLPDAFARLTEGPMGKILVEVRPSA
jgi:NADPH2:quinone reductase